MSGLVGGPISPGSTLNGRVMVLAVLAWAWVILPFLYGLYRLLIKISALFGG
ncbi:MAG TPA: hypothetical protein VFN75_09320 [Pseudonocardiaceae bacterium]|nr:hypothetical protein [Pseudonocardiaceae bacterium]